MVFGAESHSSEASGQPSASPLVDTSEKVRYEKTALRISVADHSPAFLTSKQKIESKKLYSLTLALVNTQAQGDGQPR